MLRKDWNCQSFGSNSKLIWQKIRESLTFANFDLVEVFDGGRVFEISLATFPICALTSTSASKMAQPRLIVPRSGFEPTSVELHQSQDLLKDALPT